MWSYQNFIITAYIYNNRLVPSLWNSTDFESVLVGGREDRILKEYRELLGTFNNHIYIITIIAIMLKIRFLN